MNEEGAGGLPAEGRGSAGADSQATAGHEGGGEAVASNARDEAAASRVPLLPGFREMALRRMSQDRGRLMRELAARRQETGLSQTEVAARMRTSQSAVARLESGDADVRASTLERYAAALGTEITWKVQD